MECEHIGCEDDGAERVRISLLDGTVSEGEFCGPHSVLFRRLARPGDVVEVWRAEQRRKEAPASEETGD